MNRVAARIGLIALLAGLASALPGPGAAPPALEPVLIWESTFAGGEEAALKWPMAVASASPGEVAVADSSPPRVVLFLEAEGAWKAVRTIPLSASPTGMAAVGDHYLVSARGARGLIRVDRRKWSLDTLPLPEGTVPGALASLPGGGALVVDLAGRQVVEIGESGAVLKRTPVTGSPRALAAAPAGGFYAALPDAGRIARYGADGKPGESWTVPGVEPTPAWPVGLVMASSGRLAVLDRHGGRVVVLDAGGTPVGIGSRRGWDPGLLYFPAALATLPDGRIAVADQGNGRVQIFRRAGKEGEK